MDLAAMIGAYAYRLNLQWPGGRPHGTMAEHAILAAAFKVIYQTRRNEINDNLTYDNVQAAVVGALGHFEEFMKKDHFEAVSKVRAIDDNVISKKVDDAISNKMDAVISKKLDEVITKKANEAIAKTIHSVIMKTADQAISNKVGQIISRKVDEIIAKKDEDATSKKIDDIISLKIDEIISKKANDAVFSNPHQAAAQKVHFALPKATNAETMAGAEHIGDKRPASSSFPVLPITTDGNVQHSPSSQTKRVKRSDGQDVTMEQA